MQTNRRINFQWFSKYLFGALDLPMCKSVEYAVNRNGACRRHYNRSLTMSGYYNAWPVRRAQPNTAPSNTAQHNIEHRSTQYRQCLSNGYINWSIRPELSGCKWRDKKALIILQWTQNGPAHCMKSDCARYRS